MPRLPQVVTGDLPQKPRLCFLLPGPESTEVPDAHLLAQTVSKGQPHSFLQEVKLVSR